MAKLAKIKDAEEENVEEGQEEAVSSVLGSAEESVTNDNATTTGDETESAEGESTDDAGENPETAPPENGIVVEEPVYAVPAKEKTVKVALVCDHTCYIGGTCYHFRKGETTSVPEPIKDILKNAGLLAAL